MFPCCCTCSTFEKLEADTADQNPAQPDLLQLVEWSPANNGIAFVYENDVYYRPNPMKGTASIRLTNTGGPQIYNGIADWVYEGMYITIIFVLTV